MAKTNTTTMIKKAFILFAFMISLSIHAQTLSTDPLEQHIDNTIRPQDDFFQYANGAWFQANPIPASEQENGIFKTIQDTVDAQVFSICQQALTGHRPYGSAEQKIGDLYFTAMDSATLNSIGIDPLKDDIAQMRAINGHDEVIMFAAYVALCSRTPFFSFYVGQDQKNSDVNTLYIGQGGLSLPDRRYYLENDEQSLRVREQFLLYARTLFMRMDEDEAYAQKAADELLAFELELARFSKPREDTRDPFENYFKMSVDSLVAMAPQFYWPAFFREVGLMRLNSVVVEQPEFIRQFSLLFEQTSVEVLRNYLRFKYLDGLAAYADDALYDAYFNFYSKALRGVEEQRPRWKRAVSATNHLLGDLVGQIYVEKYLPKGTKEKFIEIGNAVRKELAIRIQNLAWMSAETKNKALDKLNAVVMKLAYPDKWKDLSQLHLARTSYLKNMLAYNRWDAARNLHKLNEPVDREEWYMQPQTYNAYYSPANNEICIPGCNIIVPGFKGMPDDAVLYAIIGGTFGHEITHGFDDQGCLFDKRGNLENWWTDKDKEQFDKRTQLIVSQFDNYYITDSLHINGSLTQGENIADLGGVIVALEAYKKTPEYQSGKNIGAFTPLQRFFLGYAQAWMEQMRPEALQTQVKSNEHAPAKWRVNGPLSNIADFYEAFQLKPGDKLYRKPAERVEIW